MSVNCLWIVTQQSHVSPTTKSQKRSETVSQQFLDNQNVAVSLSATISRLSRSRRGTFAGLPQDFVSHLRRDRKGIKSDKSGTIRTKFSPRGITLPPRPMGVPAPRTRVLFVIIIINICLCARSFIGIFVSACVRAGSRWTCQRMAYRHSFYCAADSHVQSPSSAFNSSS